MPQIPKVLIGIDGTPVHSYKHLSIVQKMYDHHTFTIIISHEVMKAIGNHTLDKSKWLGKLAIILMGDNQFTGIVTSVNMDYRNGHFGDLIVSGFSNTILLESGPHLFSWTDRAFRDIISEASSYAGGLETIIEPKYSDKIEYMVQYRESNFAFLKRLACQFNEWFYYDGDNLLFGKPAKLPNYSITYGTDTKNVQILSRLRPVQYGGFSYHSTRNVQLLGTTKDTVQGLDEIGSIAFKASKDLFNFYPLITSGPRVPDKKSLDDVLKNTQAAASASLSTARGSTTLRSLRPGVKIDLKYGGTGGVVQKYLVTSVHHTSSENFNYLNHFEAVPAAVQVLPEPNIANPVAHPEIAKVMSNDDPKKKGRIKVQTQWQEAQDLASNWVRVMTPDAGHSENVGTNRGFVSIPENGDQVILGYRYGDPNRPFIMGSLFHGINGAGGDANNKIKSFTTRSGSTMTMDEDQGGVLLSDHGSANTFMDGAGNHTTNAAATANINVGGKKNEPPNSFLIMDNNGSITIDGKEKITLQVGTNAIVIDSNGVKILSECGDVICSAGNLIDISSPNNHIAGETRLDEGDVFIN